MFGSCAAHIFVFLTYAINNVIVFMVRIKAVKNTYGSLKIYKK
jgi:hypothetical protein